MKKLSVQILAACALLLAAGNAVGVPVITRQPTPAINDVSMGARLTNRVTATSASPPISYQWRLNGADVPGATTNLLTLRDIQTNQAGSYTLVATDSTGSVESRACVVKVDPVFTMITGTALTVEKNGNSVGWADLNNDSWPDLVLSGLTNSLGAVFTNNADGTFTKILPTTFKPNPPGSVLGIADIDNDGWLDAVTVGPFVQSLFRNMGGGNLKLLESSPVSLTKAKSITTAWADYNNDGNIDLYVGLGPNYLFHNTGNGVFTNVPGSALIPPQGGAQACAWGDYNNDRFPDLFVCNAPNAKNSLYRNNTDGTFTKILNDPVVADTANFSGCAWGDYDNDGFLDLFVSTFGTRNFLYHNEGNGKFRKVTNTPISTDAGHSYSSAWVDYDNDGHLDLYVSNGGNDFAGVRKDFFYRNLGGGKFVRILTGSMVNEDAWTYGCAWGDYNRDGFQDLFVVNIYDTGDNSLFKNNGNTNNWLTVTCAGRVSNRAAIGAKVRVKATIGGVETWQMREISGGSGAGCQPEQVAAFGLGDATNVTALRVEWPSGIVQEFSNVAARQFLTIKEPSKVAASKEDGEAGVRLTLYGAQGIAYSLEDSEDMVSWHRVVTLTNQTGKVSWGSQTIERKSRFYRAKEL
jgi:hypothetical protein